MPSIIVNDVRWWSDGCSPERYWTGKDGTGDEAPPEVYEAVYRKWERRLGRKPSGAPKKKERAGDRRWRLLHSGLTLEKIAEIEGKDIDVIRRSMGKDRCGQ